MRLTNDKIELLLTGTREQRAYACARSFELFAKYYFTKYFTFPAAPFHHDFFQDFQDLVEGRVRAGTWITFRESAKTSIAATMGLTWLIARQQVIDGLRTQGEEVSHWGERHFVNVDSYAKENAEGLLFDLVTELQTNDRLIDDFGQLYNQERTKDEAQLKRVSNFITTNRIRVEAHTALQSMRGRKHGKYRPDFILRDDIENEITIQSPAITEKIISVLDAGKGGMAPHAAELTLGNYLLENGVIGYVRKAVEEAGGRVRFIPVVDRGGAIAWPAKYVKTDAEAVAVNAAIIDPSKRKVSLESKKRELNGGGRRVFEVEMMLDPVAAGSPFFDRALIERLMAQCVDPREDKASFLLWADYNPMDAYCIGADTGKGNGGDHSTSCLIDTTTIPARQVGSYANNQIPADQFAYELKRQGDMFGTCLIAPEKNSESGGSCLTTLKMIYPVDFIYRQVPLDRLTDKPLGSGELGWETNGATKYTILNNLKTAVESGHLVINDTRILKEMRSFTYTDADDLGRNRQGHFTNHFDLLMATAIAWEARKYARVKTTVTDYKQEEWETPQL